MSTNPRPHSEHQFGPQRDFWWNRDFLDLMARRWRLEEASSLADIGCGVGHWSRLLYGYLRAPARLAGIDREPRWVAEAPVRFRAAFPEVSPDLVTFTQGEATNLPLPDNSFDVVTCQTVLMHLPEPIEALKEMVRVVRPGGLLICTEPNNLWNIMSFTSLTATEPVEEMVRRFEFWVRYHRGKGQRGRRWRKRFHWDCCRRRLNRHGGSFKRRRKRPERTWSRKDRLIEVGVDVDVAWIRPRKCNGWIAGLGRRCRPRKLPSSAVRSAIGPCLGARQFAQRDYRPNHPRSAQYMRKPKSNFISILAQAN